MSAPNVIELDDDDCLTAATLNDSYTSIISSDSNADEETTTTTPRRRASSVTFQEVQVREYERILGYNPACSDGPAIAIGWNVVSQQTVGVDEFLASKTQHRCRRQLYLDRCEREEMLTELGFNEFDLIASVREIAMVQKNRLKSFQRSQRDSNGTRRRKGVDRLKSIISFLSLRRHEESVG